MGTGRKFHKDPVTRPKKKLRERRRREKTQRKRLAELGMGEAEIQKLDAKEVRQLLRKPSRIAS